MIRHPKGKAIKLAGVRSNAGLEMLYRERLQKIIDRMDRDITATLNATWKAKPPEMASDASPAETLAAAMRALSRRWQKKFDALAPELAKYFSAAAAERTDVQLAAILRKAR